MCRKHSRRRFVSFSSEQTSISRGHDETLVRYKSTVGFWIPASSCLRNIVSLYHEQVHVVSIAQSNMLVLMSAVDGCMITHARMSYHLGGSLRPQSQTRHLLATNGARSKSSELISFNRSNFCPWSMVECHLCWPVQRGNKQYMSVELDRMWVLFESQRRRLVWSTYSQVFVQARDYFHVLLTVKMQRLPRLLKWQFALLQNLLMLSCLLNGPKPFLWFQQCIIFIWSVYFDISTPLFTLAHMQCSHFRHCIEISTICWFQSEAVTRTREHLAHLRCLEAAKGRSRGRT